MATASFREDEHPNVTDFEESHWTQLAKKYWLKRVRTRNIKPGIIKTELWDILEKEFHIRSLLILESLQLLEK